MKYTKRDWKKNAIYSNVSVFHFLRRTLKNGAGDPVFSLITWLPAKTVLPELWFCKNAVEDD